MIFQGFTQVTIFTASESNFPDRTKFTSNAIMKVDDEKQSSFLNKVNFGNNQKHYITLEFSFQMTSAN